MAPIRIPGNGAISEKAAGLARALRYGGEEAIRALTAARPETVVEAVEGLVAGQGPGVDATATRELRNLLVALLDAGRHPVFLRRIAGTPLADRWLAAVLRAIDATGIVLDDLFRLRVAQEPDRVLVRIPAGDATLDVSRAELGRRVAALGSAIRRRVEGAGRRIDVALFAPNRLETILTDLACLTSGSVNVPIAADATPEQVRAILGQTNPSMLVVSDAERLETVRATGLLRSVETVVAIDSAGTASAGAMPFADLEHEGESSDPAPFRRLAPEDVATVMFTSGTTGRPKGIRFGNRQILYKRYCRAVAIPEIGEEDAFLCYLPLFHTFGRYLEMIGCLFWGSCYLLMQDASSGAILDGMRRLKPSVFISIPKRWSQLKERIVEIANPGGADLHTLEESVLDAAAREATGGRLRWGLSAAGHLDPDIFQFFQRRGIELMSGFGMTEATGGITMTPPGAYVRGTVGIPLPGIEARIAEDGELLIRGPYMMLGYDDEPRRRLDEEWFGTGDIFSVDDRGYYRIVDRKKDIYKNVKGQTIAPQRIENMLQDFDEVARVFLVGDGREYNTILIQPDREANDGKLRNMEEGSVREYFSSVIASVNRFLAPYERIVDFAILDRPFDAERGELTPKGTFVRKAIERNFAREIDMLYERAEVSIRSERMELRIPTWLLQAHGITADDLAAEGSRIRQRRSGRSIAAAGLEGNPRRFRLGNYEYELADEDEEVGIRGARILLNPILRHPQLWVGNEELVRFVGWNALSDRAIVDGTPVSYRVVSWVSGDPVHTTVETEPREATDAEQGARRVHETASRLFATSDESALETLAELESLAWSPEPHEATLASIILPRLQTHTNAAVRKRSLLLVVARATDESAASTLLEFLRRDPYILTEDARAHLVRNDPTEGAVDSLLSLARSFHPDVETNGETDLVREAALLALARDLGNAQPRWYADARRILTQRILETKSPESIATAVRERASLDEGFRDWIASGWHLPNVRGDEDGWKWEDLLVSGPDVDRSIRARLLKAVSETTFLRESVFLLGDRHLLSPSDLGAGAISATRIGSGHGKVVVRLTIRTNDSRVFEFIAKLMTQMSDSEAEEESNWVILLGTRDRGARLVPEFGGIWRSLGIWSEESIPHDTVLETIRRMAQSASPDRTRRLAAVWPNLAWSSLAVFVQLWMRSGRRMILAEPVPFNVIVGPHDYQQSARAVSISARMPFQGLAHMIRFFYESFVEATERAFPLLRGGVGRRVAFDAVLEALGEDAAIPLLWRCLGEMRDRIDTEDAPDWRPWHEDLAVYLDEVEKGGFSPRRLVMAVRRYANWLDLNPEASAEARAVTLQEIYETYGLSDLETRHPETRLRFFRRTAFAEAQGDLATELDGMIEAHRDARPRLPALLRRMTDLHRSIALTDEEKYFLARLTYAQLSPSQVARLELHEEGGETTAALVEEVHDTEGETLRIRMAGNPKEVMRLYHLFEQSGLTVTFTSEHRFLIAVDSYGIVWGGLFYREADGGVVHMEKVVVGPRYRRRGLGARLMASFLQRMTDGGMHRVTTGFFRPSYFHRFGFRVERGVAGLVRNLLGRSSESPD